MTKLIVAYRNFENAQKIYIVLHFCKTIVSGKLKVKYLCVGREMYNRSDRKL